MKVEITENEVLVGRPFRTFVGVRTPNRASNAAVFPQINGKKMECTYICRGRLRSVVEKPECFSMSVDGSHLNLTFYLDLLP